jgi:two-component system, OmpR family, sensor histidine kinase ChvG
MAQVIAINPDGDDVSVEPPMPRARVRQWNSIGFKIMVANALALLLLGSGGIAFSEYRKSLVFTELSLLEDEARLWATVMVQSGVTQPHQINLTLGNLAKISPRQAIVFDQMGKLIAETKPVALGPIDPRDPRDKETPSVVKPLVDFLLVVFPVTFNLPDYKNSTSRQIGDYPAATIASGNASQVFAWKGDGGQLMFTAAVRVPWQDGKRGTLLLVKNSTQTEEAFQMARIDVVRILMAALAITMTLTLYVAFMVARPLNKLARAAEAMRVAKSRTQMIPDMSDRGDEIGALSSVLRETTEALWERLDSIESFAADVAHELKNPLTSLRSALETLPRVGDLDKRARLMAIMNEDTQRLDRLITDIAKISRIDSELSREGFFVTSLKDVLVRVLRVYAPAETLFVESLPRQITTRERGVMLEALVPHDLPAVSGNPVRLQQVFDNLVSNAISFSPDGGRVVVVAEYRGNNYITVTVDDQGPGIPDGKLEKIFDRFYSERPQNEAFGTHSGLGLAIVRQIIKAVHGSVHAENRIDDHGVVRGARFVVRLPLVTSRR